jgi:glycine cleavage system transcriptional repressor
LGLRRETDGVPRFACFVLGEDRPGIVASVTEALLAADGNLADCSMTILAGHFAMVLLVDAPEPNAARLAERLAPVADRLDLAVTVRPISAEAGSPVGDDRWVVSVYGADHPGIVHAVTSLLAELSVNVTDLETRVIGRAEDPVFAMLLEVALPDGMDADTLTARLRERAAATGVEVSLHPSEADVL